MAKSELPDIRVIGAYDSVRIYVNGILHVRFKLSVFLGVQSWKEGNKFCVEYTLKGGEMLTEYDTLDKWKAVLNGLDEVLP